MLVDAVVDYAICMLDSQGAVATWNTGAERIAGYPAAEVIGQHYSRFFTLEDRAAGLPEKQLEAARFGGRHEAEGYRVRKDGSRFWCHTVLHRLADDQGRLIGFAEVTRDVTERMAAQQALRDSERRFRLLVEGVIDYALYMLDPNGIVYNWNSGAERMKGYKAEEIVGQHFSKFYTKEDRTAGVPARVLEVAVREGRHELEGWRVRKDGSRFWASVSVTPIRNEAGQLEGFAKITRDITERHAAQDALRQSERQFRLLVGNVTDYAIFMLDPNGIVTSWNAGAERIKGYRADEVIGQHFSRFYPERERLAGVPQQALRTAVEEGRFEAEGWRVRKDGSLFWANVVIDPIRDENGNLAGFAKITRDVTERRDAQQALQEAQAQRAHAQKMDALGQLTGGVAHDFNNLLMVVTGHIQSLKKKVGDDPRASRAAQAIELAAQRGASLTRQLLSFSRRQSSNPVVVCLADRIEASREMVAMSIGANVALDAAIAPDAWRVKVDESELELALVNLTLNARDAMPKGGTISITGRNVRLTRGDTAAGIEGDFVALRVSDTGEGIAPDILPKVFEPFFTTKESGKGSGLGLSQVYGFAHQSGGTVTIESELGKGTVITLYLPRADSADAREVPAAEMSKGGGLVLLVEDNPEVAEVTRSMLEELGYEVQAVSNAASALRVVASKDFTLMVSDINMAGDMNGIGLARAIRASRPDLPVLLVTGYSHLASQVGSEFTLLRKPYGLADLGRAAGRLIGRSAMPTTEDNVIRLHDIRAVTDRS
ncbi:MAG: PAS domain S-box protein [Alphaproteobacteria bacterium]|nr:PAS domain S-box protein [Alphaproteobacteria bacterium]MBV8406940.1 PAS domain S-box protein [Alphaproteobacteria bacterium]